MKTKLTRRFFIDAKHYIVGNIRYHFYYSRLSFLLPKYIREQIEYRINSMDRDCYDAGSCKACGCKTTALQMANKSCEAPCYPKMLSRYAWNLLKNNKYCYYPDDNDINWMVNAEAKKFVK